MLISIGSVQSVHSMCDWDWEKLCYEGENVICNASVEQTKEHLNNGFTEIIEFKCRCLLI